MMPRLTSLLLFVVASVFSISLSAQEPAAQPKPQTARQALVEIITKGGESLQKHLTVEVQALMKSKTAAPSALAMINTFKPESGSGLQAFETGDVLFVYEEPSLHEKYEVHVDNDDLAGDQDTLQLSIHRIHDGKEQNAAF